ncbi:hypothetical protein O9K51_02541 [Purpureocillium lavendulum]|uniref:Uncharacterized protein n=1 Tax=Purpureocillium lavendulum TaxID=1247861 RepID=A0AB34FXM6_9HYPO|nr:hypothetical protein O9K51_02541 [Purpureocillium lavendulum]
MASEDSFVRIQHSATTSVPIADLPAQGGVIAGAEGDDDDDDQHSMPVALSCGTPDERTF